MSDLRVGFLSSYPPRRCGIGTFTRALVQTMSGLYLKAEPSILALSDNQYQYDSQVIIEINPNEAKSFRRAAHHINRSDIELVNVQHEYGLYGGPDGANILEFYRRIRKPIVTSLHSVLTKHSAHRATLTQQLFDRSSSVIVMTDLAKQMIEEIFAVEENKVEVIPHGVPNVRPNQGEQAKQKLDLARRIVLTTFGLIGPGKGIEYGIRALKRLVTRHPSLLYVVIGATHPVIKRRNGESYRESLKKLVTDLELENHVRFINQYVNYHELVEYLKATDIYLMLQQDQQQAFSGTISYALGTGKSIVATPTPYNRTVLASSCGLLVPFDDESSIAKQIKKILTNPDLRHQLELRAYRYGRDMIWPRVALDYLKTFDLALLKAQR